MLEINNEANPKQPAPLPLLLVGRDEAEFVDRLLRQPDFIQSLAKEAGDSSSLIGSLSEMEHMKAVTDRMRDELSDLTTQLNAIKMRRPVDIAKSAPIEQAIGKLIRTLDKLLERWHRFISDSSMTKLLMKVVICASSNALIADTLLLISHFLFSIEEKPLFYVVRAYMEHWNSYNNKRMGLDTLLHTDPRDLKMQFSWDSKPVTLQASYTQLKEMLDGGMALFDIASTLTKDYDNINIYLAVLVKLRFVLCPPEELSDLVYCVLLSYQIINRIEVTWFRSDETRKDIPEIFIFPPDYENIFLEFLELFSLKECDSNTHLHILQVIKGILDTQHGADEGNDLFTCLAEHFTYIRRIVNDINLSMQGKQPIYLPRQTVENKEFVKVVMQLLCLCNLEIEDIMEISFEVASRIAFSEDFNQETVAIACLALTFQQINNIKEEHLIDRLIETIRAGTSLHIPSYLMTIASFFGRNSPYGQAQRRDSTALARKLVESPMFETISKMIPQEPLRVDTISFRALQLIQLICSEAPLLTDKLHKVISQFLDLLTSSENYPEDAETLVVIPSFLHHISLKEGEIRQRVMKGGVLEAMIGIYTLNKYVRVLSLTHHNDPVSQFFGAINRFLVNIPTCKEGILRGLLAAARKITDDMLTFEKEFDRELNGEQVTRTICYQNANSKINNLMKLMIKIYPNLDTDNKELSISTEAMYRLKYLNVHNPPENNWMSNHAKSVEDPSTAAHRLDNLCLEIQQLLQETKVEEYDPRYAPKLVPWQERNSSEASKAEHLNWKICINLNRLDRLISLARTSTDANPLYNRIELFSLIGRLDLIRGSEVTSILTDISDLLAPLGSVEQRDFLHHTLKSISERKANTALSLQYTLKRLLNEACKARSYEVTNKVVDRVNTLLEMLEVEKLDNSLKSVYFVKLKLDHVQFMLEVIPMVVHNHSQFPCNFTTFCYFYNHDPTLMMNVFLKAISCYEQPVTGDDPNLKGFIEMLRNELLKKIVVVLQTISNFTTLNEEEPEEQEESSQQADQQRANCVRFVVLSLLKSFVELALDLLGKHSCSASSEVGIKQILVSVFAGITRLASLRLHSLSKCKVSFPIDITKSITQSQFKVQCEHLLNGFKKTLIERMPEWRLYQLPIISLYLEGDGWRLYKWKEEVQSFYQRACTGIIHISKRLFQNYEIDLGVKHPKIPDVDYQKINLREELDQLNIHLTSVAYIIKTIDINEWFGQGELQIPSTTICEIVKLAEHIIANSPDMLADKSQPFEAIDGLVKRILVTVQTFRTYEIKRKESAHNLRKTNPPEEEEGEETVKVQKEVRRCKKREQKAERIQKSETKKKQEEVQPKEQKLRRRKKQRKPRLKKHNRKPLRLSMAVQSMLNSLLSQPFALIESSTLRQIMLFLTDSLKSQSKKLFKIRMEEVAPLVIQARVKDANRSGLIEDLSTLVVRLFSNQHVRLDVEASIKRIFYEIEKDAKEGWFSLKRIVAQLKKLTESFGQEPVATSFRSLCQFRRETEILTLTNKQVWAANEQDEYWTRLRPQIDLTTISTPSLLGVKNRRKSSHRQQTTVVVAEEPNKYLDYVPDGALSAVLRTIIEQMIRDILCFMDRSLNNSEMKSNQAYDFGTLTKVMRMIVRQSSILIPFITRFKCRKILNNCLSSCTERTRLIVEDLLAKRDKQTRSEHGEITFMSLLLRLFTTVSFKNVERLIFLLCLDNYVLCRSPKNVVQSIGYWIRMKVIEELGGGGCGWIRNLAYLNLLMNLLDIKQFSRQCIQEGTLTYLHKQFILTRETESADFFYAQLPCILNPLTVLHNVNLAFYVSKQKPTQVRGKHTSHQVKNQLISKKFLKKNTFTHSWIYQSSEEIMRADYGRHFHRGHDFDNYYFDSEDGTEEYEGSDSASSAEMSDGFSGSPDELQLENDEIDESISSADGWTSEHQIDGFEIGDEGESISHQDDEMVVEQPPFEPDFDEDEMDSEDDDQDGLSEEASSVIIQRVYGNDNTSQSESVQQERIFSDMHNNSKIFNTEVRRLAEQIQQLLLVIFVRKDESHPIFQKIHCDELFRLCSMVGQWMAIGEKTSGDTKKVNDISSLSINFKEPKPIFDDTNLILQFRWRRRGEIQRPRMITANSIQAEPIEAPVDDNMELAPPQPVEGEQAEQEEDEEDIEDQIDLDDLAEIEGDRPERPEREMERQIRRFIGEHLEEEEEEDIPPLGNINELLRASNMDPAEFQLLPREVQQDILHNLMNPNAQELQMASQRRPSSARDAIRVQDRAEEQEPEMEVEEQPPAEERGDQEQIVYDRRRKLSHDYIKKIAKDPREILLKDKKDQKLYPCENEFVVAVLSLLYQDEMAHNDFPFALLKSLCANPTNETKFLSAFMIILKHPDLAREKAWHGESANTFPMTILRQKNGELGTDYLNMGYAFISLKILHILSSLSRTNSSAMLEATHNKVPFLPEWYWLDEKPYYIQLIELLDVSYYKESSLRSYLTETIFNIIRHYCLKYIHDKEVQKSEQTEFRIRLKPNEVRLICSLLESSEETGHISQVVMLLCIDESNLTTFISILNVILQDISNNLLADLKNQSMEDKPTRGGHLKKILSLVYDMFQSEYAARLEKTQERSAVKNELLRSFKNLLECQSLQQLCHDWIQFMCDNEASYQQLSIITEVLECFFIIYKITMTEEQHKSKRRNISALGVLEDSGARVVEQTSLTKQYSLEAEFQYICQKGRTVVNNILKQKLSDMKKMRRKELPSSIFDDPMIYILSKNASLIDYDKKRTMFKMEIKNIKNKEKGYQTIELVLNRERVLDQSMNEIMTRNKTELKGKMHIQFEGEEGEDAGGLTREWFCLLSRAMFNPNYAIFQPSSAGNTYQPSPKSYINPQHLTFFKFAGRVVGKAMHDGFIMEAFFTPAFYKHILGLPITYRDMQEEDYEFYKNMVWITENNITDIIEETFSYEYDDFGEMKVMDLKPDGRNIPVTEENKLQYIQLLCYAKMAKAVQKQIEAFLEGFHELIPPHLASIFDSKELQLMISGLPTIDIQDLKDNTDLVNYDKHDYVIVWLFEVLEGFDSNLRASFLQFVTGTSRLPSEGFKGLRGVNGPQKFNIHKDFDSSKLPRAHTCFNQLDLPNYPSKEVLVEKLTVAITEGKEGFGML